MDFFAYYAGVNIDAFGSKDAAAARRFINSRYKDPQKVVIVPVNAERKVHMEAKEQSEILAQERTLCPECSKLIPHAGAKHKCL